MPRVNFHPRRRIVVFAIVGFALTVCFLWIATPASRPAPFDPGAVRQEYPLIWEHIESHTGTGGAWYIPPDWSDSGKPQPKSIVEAAQLASKAALSRDERQIDYSKIPLIVHHVLTTATARASSLKPQVLPYVEQWLEFAVEPAPHYGRPMAYFFWAEEGILDFMNEFEADLAKDFVNLFSPVERADIFRVLVCQRFGGVYADLDTEPLRRPAIWIQPRDVAPWTDNATSKSYGVQDTKKNSQPVSIIWGLEADTDPDSDAYWRMGYTYPIQLTNWAFASAPDHPVLKVYMDNLREAVRQMKEAAPGDKSAGGDPLTRTGPAAVTLATQTWLEKTFKFRWNALTGLKDGGKTKLVEDVLILPITGFSPGRGRYGNMGSQPVTHPDARLVHHALGSWRKFDLFVEYGKFCRTVFGLCKDWSKVPG